MVCCKFHLILLFLICPIFTLEIGSFVQYRILLFPPISSYGFCVQFWLMWNMFPYDIPYIPGVILRPCIPGAPPWSSGSVLDHKSLPPVFESWPGHIWRLFRLSLRFITFRGRSAHLAYLVHKSGRKTSIIIIIIDHIFQVSSIDHIS